MVMNRRHTEDTLSTTNFGRCTYHNRACLKDIDNPNHQKGPFLVEAIEIAASIHQEPNSTSYEDRRFVVIIEET